MTDQEPQVRPRRGPRPRLNQTPPLSESQVSLQNQEKLKFNLEVMRKTDILLKKAVDEDEMTGLRTPDTYPKYPRIFTEDEHKHIKSQRDRGVSRERSLAREEALDSAYTQIGRSMIQMLRDHNLAAVRFYLNRTPIASAPNPREIQVEAYTLPTELESARKEEILHVLDQDPKDFFNVWEEIPEGKKEKVDVDMRIFEVLQYNGPRILQEPRCDPKHGYLHHGESNILFDKLERFISRVPKSFFSGSETAQATQQK